MKRTIISDAVGFTPGPFLSVEAEVARLNHTNGKREIVSRKIWPRQDVMKMGTVRGWVRRQFNQTLSLAETDIIVTASYRGQLKVSPYTMYHGSLSGVNGAPLRADGDFAETNSSVTLAKARGNQ